MTETSIETVRDYWDRQPCGIRHSAATVGSEAYFQEVTARRYKVQPHIPEFAGFRDWTGKRVLEIGCGIGTDGAEFARNGAIYTGIDLSPESLNVARQRFDLEGLVGHLWEGDAEKLGHFAPAVYDLVYSFGVLHHTPDPIRAVEEIRRVMHPGSEFRLMLYARNSWKAAMIAAGLDQPEAQDACPLWRTYTEEQARALLSAFEILEMRQAHAFPYKIPEYKAGQYVRQPWFEAMPEPMFAALEKHLGWHLLIRCRLRGTA